MKKKMMVFLGIFFLAVMVVGYADVASSSEKVYNLKFSYHTPPKASMVGAYFNPWTAAIEKASGGRVKITHYAGESLVKSKDQYDALMAGLCDIALVDPSETPGRFAQMEFDTLPYIFPNAEIGAQVYWDILQKYSANTELKDVKVLCAATIAPSNYAGNKPSQKIADFKGMRVRAAGRTESWIVEALQGSPVEIATSDLGTSLERGLVDSCFLSWSAILSFGVKDVTKYHVECDIFSRTWMIAMNKRVWDSLPPDLQKAFMDNSGPKNSGAYSAANEKQAAGAKNAIAGSNKKAGKPPIYALSKDEAAAWKTALLPVWDKWATEMEAKTLPGKAIISDLKAFVQKYSGK
jgi:TRAP-type C4-dicarboxylate transport system substrate-binding protein